MALCVCAVAALAAAQAGQKAGDAAPASWIQPAPLVEVVYGERAGLGA